MIPNIQPTRFESNVSNLSHSFTIEMTPTLAKLLSSQTYTDKILAAIREPLSNAYDSHVRAGTLDTPAKLHLPTSLEPHFSIRDFGTGLSHDDVIRLFFSYGVSDKRDTNNEIGGLGIGAKAFFAYTDQAVITSWHNGMKRTYSANKGTNGLPQGMLVSMEESDEANGIELSYPVSYGDYHQFIDKTVDVLTYLKLKVDSNLTLNISPPKIIYSTVVGGHPIDIPASNSVRLVVMGGIAYSVPSDIWHSTCQKMYDFVAYQGFVIHLPIGSVEISASRESLSPTEQDKTFIAKILFEMRQQFKSTDWDSAVACATSWINAVKTRQDLGGFMQFDSYVVNGKTLEAKDAMRWRDVRTLGLFELNNAYPVLMVKRTGSRGNKYSANVFHTNYINQPVKAAYWMPSNKAIGWRDWYKQNINLDWHTDECHLHFKTETMEQAEELAKFFGYTGPILDGSQCRVTKASRAKPSTPKPQGMALVIDRHNVKKIELKNFADPVNEFIYEEGSKTGSTEARVLQAFQEVGIIKTHSVSIIDRFAIPKDKTEKAYAGMARSVKEWMDLHPDLVDYDKLKACALGAELRQHWTHTNWCKLHLLRDYGDKIKFVMPDVNFNFNIQELSDYVPHPNISRHVKAIQKWHDTHFKKLPPTIQKLLMRDGYNSNDAMFELYDEMK